MNPIATVFRFLARIWGGIVSILFPYRFDWIQMSLCASGRWADAHLTEHFGYRRISSIKKMEAFLEEIELAPPLLSIYQVWPTCRYVPLRNIRDFILRYLSEDNPDRTVEPKIAKAVERLLVTSLDRDRKTSANGLAEALLNEERSSPREPDQHRFIVNKMAEGALSHEEGEKVFPIDSLEEFEGKLSAFLDATRLNLIKNELEKNPDTGCVPTPAKWGTLAKWLFEDDDVFAELLSRHDLLLWEESSDFDEIFNVAIDCYVDFSIASNKTLVSMECEKLCREIVERIEDREKRDGSGEQNDFTEFLRSSSWGFQRAAFAALARNPAVSGICRTTINSLAQLSTKEFLENPVHGSVDLAGKYYSRGYYSIVRFLMNSGRMEELEKYGLTVERRINQAKETASWSSELINVDLILEDPSSEVRLAFIRAVETRLDPNILLKFARDPSAKVQLALAEKNDCEEEILQVLADSRFESVRKVVAQHPKTPLPLLWEIFKQGSLSLRRAVCENSKIPRTLFLKCIDDPSFLCKKAGDASLSGKVLNKLVTLHDPVISKLVAGNPNTPQETLFELGRTYPREFFANPVHLLCRLGDLDWDEKIPLDCIKAHYINLLQAKEEDELEQHGLTLSIRLQAIKELELKREEFLLLCRDPAPEVRKEIASGAHHKANLARLELAEKGTKAEHILLVKNPISEPRVLEELVRRGKPEVRMRVAKHTSPEAHLAHLTLAESGTIQEKKALAGNESASKKALGVLAKNPRGDVRTVVAKNSSKNAAEAHQYLAQNGKATERLNLAKNPRIPSGALLTLSQDPEPKIRNLVVEKLKSFAQTLVAVIENGQLDPYMEGGIEGFRRTSDPELCILAMNLLATDFEIKTNENLADPTRVLFPEAKKMVTCGNLLNRRHLARNHKTPAGILAILARDKVKEVRKTVALNHETYSRSDPNLKDL